MDMQNKSDEIEEIFSYYSQQPDKGSQEMVVALLRELQDAHGFISLELKERVEQVTGVSPTIYINFSNNFFKSFSSLPEYTTSSIIILGAVPHFLRQFCVRSLNFPSIDTPFF